jgi:ABC-type glutathione transport system ATPase component
VPALLSVRDLTVHFCRSGITAVDRVCFDLNEGATLGILGESGAGKTTLGRTLLRLQSADANLQGSILFRGTEILRADEDALSKIRGAGIALISQEPGLGLNPFIRIGGQIEEVLRAHTSLSKRDRCQRALEMIAAVGFCDRDIYFAYPHQLSGGQRQRAVIAQALVAKPALLIADEPTSALDTVTQAEIMSLLGTLRQSFQVAVIFITHDPRLLSSLTDRMLVMRAGRIVESGAAQQICGAPQDPYTHRLLRFVPPHLLMP